MSTPGAAYTDPVQFHAEAAMQLQLSADGLVADKLFADADYLLRQAQVHATLALTAAVAKASRSTVMWTPPGGSADD